MALGNQPNSEGDAEGDENKLRTENEISQMEKQFPSSSFLFTLDALLLLAFLGSTGFVGVYFMVSDRWVCASISFKSPNTPGLSPPEKLPLPASNPLGVMPSKRMALQTAR